MHRFRRASRLGFWERLERSQEDLPLLCGCTEQWECNDCRGGLPAGMAESC